MNLAMFIFVSLLINYGHCVSNEENLEMVYDEMKFIPDRYTFGSVVNRLSLKRRYSSVHRSNSESKSSFNVKRYEIYMQQQDNDAPFEFEPSATFRNVPSLCQTFNVDQPTLFKITLQCGVYNGGQGILLLVQILVNNYVIINNKLIPNTIEALKGNEGKGGFLYSGGGVTYEIVSPLTRIISIYLPAGTYTFNVGVRSHYNRGKLESGMITYEMTQFENNTLQQIGGLNLTKFPKLKHRHLFQ